MGQEAFFIILYAYPPLYFEYLKQFRKVIVHLSAIVAAQSFFVVAGTSVALAEVVVVLLVLNGHP